MCTAEAQFVGGLKLKDFSKSFVIAPKVTTDPFMILVGLIVIVPVKSVFKFLSYKVIEGRRGDKF